MEGGILIMRYSMVCGGGGVAMRSPSVSDYAIRRRSSKSLPKLSLLSKTGELNNMVVFMYFFDKHILLIHLGETRLKILSLQEKNR